jgi:glycosyltransferase involved in cell wall biosynthesis
MGLDNALELAERLKETHNLPVELIVVGKITDEHRSRINSRARLPIQWMGSIAREHIPGIMRSAHLLYSADLHPACPNSVIEALACGLPVLAFDTGAMKELVIGDSGRIVPYGSDPWKIEKPAIPALAEAALEILNNQSHFRSAARAHAESALGLDKMVDEYLKVLL